MNDPFFQDENATPLAQAERDGLLPTHITLRQELNELEQSNILEADQWAMQRKRNVLDESFLLRLHKKMFGKVWRWAGVYRKTERNLGVVHWRIQTDLLQLIDDVQYWIHNETYDFDEIAVRFHHRLVVIHPFPNGNGRWSRLAADILVVNLGRARFSWGQHSLHKAGDVRRAYINALRAADNHDVAALVFFAREKGP